MEFEFEISGKWLETLKEIAPHVNHVIAVNNPDNQASSAHVRTLETVASSLGLQLTRADIHSASDIERVCSEFARKLNGGVVIVPDVITFAHREMIAALMIRHRLPAVYAFRPYVSSGGLVSYGTDTTDLVQRAAAYLDRILKGEKAGELPIQQPTKFELLINEGPRPHDTALTARSRRRGDRMRRREFLTLLGSAALTWTWPLSAQQTMPLIGFLHSATSESIHR